MRSLSLLLAILFAAGRAITAQSSLQQDSASFDSSGTARITRVVPMPDTISPEAQKWLASLAQNKQGPETLAERRARTDAWRAQDSAEALRDYPVSIEESSLAGVRTDLIAPLANASPDRVLINLHGGGFNSDSGSRIEGDPIANLSKIKVVSVYYRLAPENPFPLAVDDAVVVYKELLKTYRAHKIGIYGTSAGGILTAEVAVRLKQLGLPLPGALGMFSILADFSRPGDSRQFFSLNGLPGILQPVDPERLDDQYVGATNRKDPVLSPLFADLHGMPPSLLVTSTRDALLSQTTIFHRALLRAGDDAQLVVFEALPHAFWYHFQLPETREALELMAKFFEDKLGH